MLIKEWWLIYNQWVPLIDKTNTQNFFIRGNCFIFVKFINAIINNNVLFEVYFDMKYRYFKRIIINNL